MPHATWASGQVGKWHLNGDFNKPTQPQPGDHGFDHWFSTQNNALPNHHDSSTFVRDGREVGVTSGYSSAIVADEAIRWLREMRDKSKPFFLYVCFHEPHEPIATEAQYKKLYPSDDPSFSTHHGNITQMDANFGRLMRALDEDKLHGNTLVIFTSDNGPAERKKREPVPSAPSDLKPQSRAFAEQPSRVHSSNPTVESARRRASPGIRSVCAASVFPLAAIAPRPDRRGRSAPRSAW